jgi:hypothetical protein
VTRPVRGWSSATVKGRESFRERVADPFGRAKKRKEEKRREKKKRKGT